MARGYKTGGRTEGTPNRITGEVRERINSIIESEFTSEAIKKDLSKLDPEKRLKILIKLLEYTTPKLLATRFEGPPAPLISISPIEWVGTKEKRRNRRTIFCLQ